LLPREIVIVDDGGSDWEESKQIAASYPDNISVRFIRLEQNQGVSVARNIGVKASVCRYISFLDSDEVWFKEKLAIQYAFMERGGIDFSMHGLMEGWRDLSSHVDGENHAEPLWFQLSSWSLLFKNHCTSTVMVLREKMEPFDPSLRRIEDWKCWMEVVAQNGVRSAYIRHTLAERFKPGLGTSGLSQDVKAMHTSRMTALKRLINEDKITLYQFLVGICMESAKYPLRIIIIAASRRGVT
jgi:glycosyltransferase involved in cell wall biosynthesis